MEKPYSVKPKRLLIAIAGVLSWLAALYLGAGTSQSTFGDIIALPLLIVGPPTAVGAMFGRPGVGLLCGIASLLSIGAMMVLIMA